MMARPPLPAPTDSVSIALSYQRIVRLIDDLCTKFAEIRKEAERHVTAANGTADHEGEP